MATNSEVITLNPVEYTEKMQKVLSNFTRLSRETAMIQDESAIFTADINNLATHLYYDKGDDYAIARLDNLDRTEYCIEILDNIASICVRFVSKVPGYNQQIILYVDIISGEVERRDFIFTESTNDNGVVDKRVDLSPTIVRNPLGIISHINADMYMMMQNHTALSLGKVAS